MSSEPERLQTQIESLLAALKSLERRVVDLEDALETRPHAERVLTSSALSELERKPDTSSPRLNLSTVLTLAGRSALVLGGAFFLRALTDANVVSLSVLVVLGAVYAVVWLWFADWAASRRRWTSATVHGLMVAIIAFPLIGEAVTKFNLLSTTTGAAGIAVFAGAGLLVSWRRRLRSLAWVFATGATLTCLMLMAATREMIPFVAVLLILGLVTIWMAYRQKWHLLRWPVAFALDLAVIVAIFMAAAGKPGADILGVRFLGLGLLLTYLGSFAVRTLIRRRDVSLFEVIQSISVVLIGFGGTIYLGRLAGQPEAFLEFIALACAASAYLVAFRFVDQRVETRNNFYFYSWLGLLFILLGSTIAAGGIILTVVLSALALLATFLGSRYNRMTLRYQGAVYAVIAAYQGALLSTGWRAFTGDPTHFGVPLSLSVIFLFVVCVICYVSLALSPTAAVKSGIRLLPRFVIGALAVLGGTGLLVMLITRILAGDAGSVDPAVLAAIRTAVLSTIVFALSLGGRRARMAEMVWLAYPLIILGGIKLLVEDLPTGRPATLFVGLAFYGIALITASRMLRARQATSATPAE